MNDYYDEYYSKVDQGDVTITGGNSQNSEGEGFAPIDEGNMEGAASMVPESDISPDAVPQGANPGAAADVPAQ